MAKKKFLSENKEQIWPITRADCVYTEDGKKLLSEDYASKKYVDDSIAENGFSGDYNDLENKPCYENTALMRKTFNIDTTTATEQIQSYGTYCYINDLPLPFDLTESMDLTYTHATNGGSNTINGKVPRKLNEDLYCLDSNNGYPLVFIVLKDGASYSGISGALHKGVYAAKSAYSSERVTSLTYSALDGEIKQLDEKFIPDTIATKKYVDDSLSNHNHTLLYDIEGLYFASEETDSASIEVTKDRGNTYMDFYLDDDTDDMWRWRFGTLVDSDTAEFKIFDAMTLRAINKSESELDVTGNVRSLGLIGVSGEEWENVSRTIDQDCKFEFSSHINKNAAGLFPTDNNSNSIISFNRHDGEYSSQLGFNSNGQMYYRHTNGEAITEQTEWQKIYTDKNKPTPEDIGAATKEYVDDEITKLRDEMIVLDEDDLSIDGLIDSTFPSLATEDKTLIGAINEVNENIQNIKPAEEEIEKAVIDEMLMDVFGVVVDEEAN